MCVKDRHTLRYTVKIGKKGRDEQSGCKALERRVLIISISLNSILLYFNDAAMLLAQKISKKRFRNFHGKKLEESK